MSIDTPSIPPQPNGVNGHQFTEAPLPTAPIETVEWPWDEDDATPEAPEAPEVPEATAEDAGEDHGLFGHKRLALKRRPSPEPKPRKAPKAAKAPKAQEARKKGKFPRWALLIIVPFFAAFYVAFFAGATVGQAFFLSSDKVTSSLPKTHNFELDFTAGVVIGGMLEFASVGLMILSLIVRIEGERGTLIKWFSFSLAFIAVGLNSIGHVWIGDVVGAVVFTICSAVAFVAAGQMIEFFMRQIQIARGRRLVPRPPYPMRLRLKQPQMVRLAGELFDENPEIGLLGSLNAARAKLEAERKETDRIERELKEQAKRDEEITLIEGLLFEMALDEYGDETAAKIQVLADGPAATVKRIVEAGDPDAAARRVRARMEAQREQNATSRIRRIAVEAAVENMSNPASNNPVEEGSKFGRILGRKSPRKAVEFRSNSESNKPSNSVSNSGRKSVEHAPAESVESASNSVERIDLSGLEYEERKDRARDYLWSLIKSGTAFENLPTGGQIEREFNIATAGSRGGVGNSLKKQIRAKLDEHMQNGGQFK